MTSPLESSFALTVSRYRLQNTRTSRKELNIIFWRLLKDMGLCLYINTETDREPSVHVPSFICLEKISHKSTQLYSSNIFAKNENFNQVAL